jgi:hypothetical protein
MTPDLEKSISNVLKKTEIGQYTEIIKVQKKSTFFYVENKEFSSSTVFESEKEKIRMQIAFEKAQLVLDDWINSEVKNYYVSLKSIYDSCDSCGSYHSTILEIFLNFFSNV